MLGTRRNVTLFLLTSWFIHAEGHQRSQELLRRGNIDANGDFDIAGAAAATRVCFEKTSTVCVTNKDGRFCGRLSSMHEHSGDREPEDGEGLGDNDEDEEKDHRDGKLEQASQLMRLASRASRFRRRRYTSITRRTKESKEHKKELKQRLKEARKKEKEPEKIQKLKDKIDHKKDSLERLQEKLDSKIRTSTGARTASIKEMQSARSVVEPEIDYITSCNCSGCSACELPPSQRAGSFTFPQGSLTCTPYMGCLEFWVAQNDTYQKLVEECSGKAATCGQQDCVECSGCLQAVVNSPMCAEELLTAKRDNLTCLDMEGMTSCQFSMNKCSAASPMCLNQLLCREPCVCEGWKRKHCLGLDVRPVAGRTCDLTKFFTARNMSKEMRMERQRQRDEARETDHAAKVEKWNEKHAQKIDKDAAKTEAKVAKLHDKHEDRAAKMEKRHKKKMKKLSLIERTSRKIDRRAQDDGSLSGANGFDLDASLAGKCMNTENSD